MRARVDWVTLRLKAEAAGLRLINWPWLVVAEHQESLLQPARELSPSDTVGNLENKKNKNH